MPYVARTIQARPVYFDVLVGSFVESSVVAVVTGIHNVEMIFTED